MTDYKVSVIIPAYNSQNTIKRCIDSVISQTMGFSNIELILYDDNSTDGTREILKEYSNEYENIVLILSDENSGYAGKGRNEGIKIASAEYIMFLDNDDEYLPDMCETLYNEIVKEDADFVSSNFLDIDEISSTIRYNDIKGDKTSKNNKIILLNEDVFDFRDVLVWSKIYKKSIIIDNSIEFPEDKIAEDMYFIFMLLFYVNKIVYLKNYVGYLRHVREDSLSHTSNYVKIRGMMNICFDMYSFYKNSKRNMDFSWLSASPIGFCLGGFYSSNILDNKDEVDDLINDLYKFEKETNFNNSYLDIIYRIPNKLIMNKQFDLAIIYFKVIREIFKSNFLRRIYRIFDK